MSKMDGLQQALKQSSSKPSPERPESKPIQSEATTPVAKGSNRKGKEYVGAWLKTDFGSSLRLVQLRRRRDDQGNKIYLDDLMAEALNDLFIKYDVPTVLHD